jgi:hypothetical protein
LFEALTTAAASMMGFSPWRCSKPVHPASVAVTHAKLTHALTRTQSIVAPSQPTFYEVVSLREARP